MPKTVMVAYGTRPEAVKLAPLINALRESHDFVPTVCVTAQHRRMLDQFNQLFEIQPDFDLDIMRPEQTLTQLTTGVLKGMERVFTQARPEAVIVQGDTTTTMGAALAAHYQRVPVIHLEAGLRTGHRYSPYPEEINRRITTQLTTLHLTPTTTSLHNLEREGIPRTSIVVTGNTVIDALQWILERSRRPRNAQLRTIAADTRRILLVTTHRRESWGGPMTQVAEAIRILSRTYDDMLVVFPMHKNPVVRNSVLPVIQGLHNVVVLEPLEYDDFAWCLQRSHVVMTDSGGIQEEAPSLGKPVLVLRDNTERPEAVEAGAVRVVGTDKSRVIAEVHRVWSNDLVYNDMSTAINPYGDGHAARRSIAALRYLLMDDVRPDEFSPTMPERILSPYTSGIQDSLAS